LKLEGRSIAVLGAGALGLSAAFRLAQLGAKVTVLEREPLAGGLAAGFQPVPGVWLERFYHHLFRSDRHAISLIEELGLGDALTWHRPVTATRYRDREYQLDSPMSLLRFTPLSPIARLRMGATLAFLRALPRAGLLEGRTASSWLRSTMGHSGFEIVWEPLLRAKFGTAANEISLPWFWARVHDRTAELGYLAGGFQQLYDRLRDAVTELGGSVRLGTEVTSIGSRNGALEVGIREGQTTDALDFDLVVSTLPTRLTCRLTPELPDWYRQRHDRAQAVGAHCLILGLDRPLTDVYWLNINDPEYPFMAVVEHTNMRSPSEYQGLHIVYLANYRPMDDPIFKTSKDDLITAWMDPLRRLNPDFDRHWIQASWSHAAPFAQPIVTPAYREHIPPFDTPVKNLFVANMFQVYPHDRGQNYSIELAEKLTSFMAAVG
jgi:protoporphyrinogen oxidase